MGNININGKSAVHAKSEGQLITTDTCMTPPFCIPINYTNQAESKMADMTASSVKIQDSPACNSKSNFKISKGDAPGCCGGTSSGTTQQLAEFITFSNDVMIEGKPAVRNGDKMVSNNRNTAPQPLVQPPAENAPVKTAKAPAAKGDYSQQVDLSDFIGMDPETGRPVQSLPYVFRDKDGNDLGYGQTDRHGETQQVETLNQEKIVLYAGDGDWELGMDSIHNMNSESALSENEEHASSLPAIASPDVGTLDLGINDPRGNPIPNLDYKILTQNEIVFSGKTDANGRADTIENLKLGSRFDIYVKSDNGVYKKVATGTIQAEASLASLKSPKTRFEFSTYLNTGKPGKAAAHKEEVIASHNQQPASTPTTSGNEQKKITVKDDRNDAGHPVAAVVDGSTNMYGVNNGKAVPPPKDALGKLNVLIEFMEHQSTLNYVALPQTEVTEQPPKGSKKPPKISKHDITTEEIITQMINKKFKEPKTKLPTDPTTWCAKYVKVGLWYAGYGPATESIGKGIGPARMMGDGLRKADFKDISRTLPKIKINVGSKLITQPDITFTLPGDVIVYEKTDAPNDSGHIDVRTYHGFVSDMYPGPARNCFPNVRKYTVTGVYRKYSDTLAEARVKAFLKIIRSYETEGFKEEESYFVLPAGKDKETGKLQRRKFEGDKNHPFDDAKDNLPYKYEIKDFYGNKNTSAGAYQLKWDAFNQAKLATGWPSSFTPLDQDRAAIYELQGRTATETHPKRTALGYIMEGKVKQAVNDTKLWKLFDCLPGDGRKVKLSMEELDSQFSSYTKEFSK